MTSGDFDGDGKTDVGVLYNNGQQTDGTNLTALWTFTSNGGGFNAPVKKWDNDDRTTGSWNWDRSKITVGDYNGDGKADIGVLYDNGQSEDSRNQSALWTMTSTGSGFNGPAKKWDSGTSSWNADASKLTSGDFDGDGKTDVGVLYGYGQQDQPDRPVEVLQQRHRFQQPGPDLGQRQQRQLELGRQQARLTAGRPSDRGGGILPAAPAPPPRAPHLQPRSRTPMSRRTSRARLAAAVSLTSVASMAGALLAAGPATAASLSTWDKVAQCEATGNWQAIDPTGSYFGGLQFSQSTWQAYGGLTYASRADRATNQQQILIGEKLLKGQGEGAWPHCGPASGLGADHADPYPDPVPPASKVTGPGAGTVLTGPVSLTASVTDAVGTPTGATFYVEGTAVGSATGSGPSYAVTLDTTSLSDGPHTLTVKATNDAGQTGPASAGVSFFTANRAAATQTTGDFNGDGKDDIAILYGNGEQEDGSNQTALWTLLSKGTAGFADPVKVWDNLASGSGSWDWIRSKVTTGDFNGDGKADIGVLYNNGQQAGGTNQTALWTFTSTGAGFTAPVKAWQTTESWHCNRSKLTAGDFNGDGKSDVGVLYNDGRQPDGINKSALWTATGTGTGFGAPVKKWESADSWNADASKMTAGDFDGDGRADIGVLYNYGQNTQGTNRSGLWTFTSNRTGLNAPTRVWDSANRGGSWNWYRSDLV